MIVGAVSGLPTESLKPWSASARNVYRGPMYLLTDTPQNYAELTETYGVETWFAPLRTDTEGVCGIARTRWKALADLLADIEPQLPVVFADTRDVVFQSDPHEIIGDVLVLGGEGKRHDENAWCLGWLKALYPNEWENLRGVDVLNAGVVGGPAGRLRCFALHVWGELPTIPCDCTRGQAHMADQTAVNYLVRNSFGEQATIRYDWVYHVASTEYGRIPATISASTGKLLRQDNVPFPIVHQYDRAEQLRGYANIR